jgi:hypothetical protein
MSSKKDTEQAQQITLVTVLIAIAAIILAIFSFIAVQLAG